MAVFLTLIIIVVAILLILLVLVQPGKADMGATFGGLGSQMGNMFGNERSRNILATATKVCAGIIMLLVLVTNKFFVGGNDNVQKIITEGARTSAVQNAPKPKMPAQVQPSEEQKPAQTDKK